MDQPHSVRMGGQSYYYTRERPGHVSGLLNAQGQVVNRYTYDPWGSVGATEAVTQPLRYGAREYDAETGLYYLRARYYDPGFGRFISEDPIGLEGGINLYAYAANDPGNLLDPFGLSPSDCNSQVGDWVDPRQETQRQLCFSLGGVASGSIDWPFSTGSNSGFGLQLGSRGYSGLVRSTLIGIARAAGSRKNSRDYVLEGITDFGIDTWDCGREHFAMDGIVDGALTLSRAGSYLAATPVHKRTAKKLLGIRLFVIPGASQWTNALNVALHATAGKSFFRNGAKHLGTRSAATMVGRANVLTAVGFAAYDATSILSCALDR